MFYTQIGTYYFQTNINKSFDDIIYKLKSILQNNFMTIILLLVEDDSWGMINPIEDYTHLKWAVEFTKDKKI